VLCNVF